MPKLVTTTGFCAALVGAGLTGPAVRAQDVSGGRSFAPVQAISYVLGSKRAVGYFLSVSGECRLTLMITESSDADTAKALSGARLRLSMPPGQSLALTSEEGEALTVLCGANAECVLVVRTSAASSPGSYASTTSANPRRDE